MILNILLFDTKILKRTLTILIDTSNYTHIDYE